MTLLTAPNVQPDTADNGVDPINLYKLGMLFVVKCRYWSCRAGNDPDELDLTQDRIDAKAIASFGTKDLLDPDKTRKVFEQIEKKARHALEKHSRPFAAANAHFVPWNHVQAVIEQLEALKAEFDEAAQRFLAEYPQLRAEWQAQHPEIGVATEQTRYAINGVLLESDDEGVRLVVTDGRRLLRCASGSKRRSVSGRIFRAIPDAERAPPGRPVSVEVEGAVARSYSGADIEQVVNTGLKLAFHGGSEAGWKFVSGISPPTSRPLRSCLIGQSFQPITIWMMSCRTINERLFRTANRRQIRGSISSSVISSS